MFGREATVSGAKRLRPNVVLAVGELFVRAPVLLPAVGGFPFGQKPNVVLAVGELFVRARSARSQARSACVIARRRRVSVRSKTERFAGATAGFNSAKLFARRRQALCPGAKRP